MPISPGIVIEGVSVPGVFSGICIKYTAVSGTGVRNVPNLPKCWVHVFDKVPNTPVGLDRISDQPSAVDFDTYPTKHIRLMVCYKKYQTHYF